MKTRILSFTDAGEDLSLKLLGLFKGVGEFQSPDILKNSSKVEQTDAYQEVKAYKKSKYGVKTELVEKTESSLQEWTKENWQSDLLIFVGATGIAVRAIAPFVQRKDRDPAVLVIDEKGTFCISLLSGHLGGANAYAREIAEKIGAIPVITTATDLNDRFAVDLFAKEHDLQISDIGMIKKISSAILKNQKVGMVSDLELKVKLPEEIRILSEKEAVKRADKVTETAAENLENSEIRTGIYIGPYDKHPFEETMQLIPKVLVVGMGCRKGKEKENLKAFLEEVFAENNLKPQAICQISSIDVKKEEAGLLGLADDLQVDFKTYSKEELNGLEGEFTPSTFVNTTVGVDNVCERSAVMGSLDCDKNIVSLKEGNEKARGLIVRKQAKDGMTIAVALCHKVIGEKENE